MHCDVYVTRWIFREISMYFRSADNLKLYASRMPSVSLSTMVDILFVTTLYDTMLP